jgi:hypothetical protein
VEAGADVPGQQEDAQKAAMAATMAILMNFMVLFILQFEWRINWAIDSIPLKIMVGRFAAREKRRVPNQSSSCRLTFGSLEIFCQGWNLSPYPNPSCMHGCLERANSCP